MELASKSLFQTSSNAFKRILIVPLLKLCSCFNFLNKIEATNLLKYHSNIKYSGNNNTKSNTAICIRINGITPL